jgi:hypothetical protein
MSGAIPPLTNTSSCRGTHLSTGTTLPFPLVEFNLIYMYLQRLFIILQVTVENHFESPKCDEVYVFYYLV